MSKTFITAILISIFIPTHLFAATIYMRFEGLIDSFYDFNPNADASFGFLPNQAVYFDFQIDLALDVAGYPDSGSQDNFAVTYLEGSLAGTNVTRGSTTFFPEGTSSWLYITDSLMVGTNWYFDLYGNDGIDTWTVGSSVKLMNNSYFLDNNIGSLNLTYSASTPPPVHTVPVPAAVWLFVSGLGMLLTFIKQKQN